METWREVYEILHSEHLAKSWKTKNASDQASKNSDLSLDAAFRSRATAKCRASKRARVSDIPNVTTLGLKAANDNAQLSLLKSANDTLHSEISGLTQENVQLKRDKDKLIIEQSTNQDELKIMNFDLSKLGREKADLVIKQAGHQDCHT